MKSASIKTPYFSAYPLKALNLPEEELQSELMHWENGSPKTITRIRVLPMVNPYRERDFIVDNKENNPDK